MQKMTLHENKYPWTICLTTLQKSHFQTANVQKMSLHESRYSWTVGFMIRQKSLFQAAKKQKMNSRWKRGFGPFRSLNHNS